MRSEGYGSWVCLSVCLCVCLLCHISPLEHLFVLKSKSRTQQATKVKKFVGIFLKLLHCEDPALPTMYGYVKPAIFRYTEKMCMRMPRHLAGSRRHGPTKLRSTPAHKFGTKIECRKSHNNISNNALSYNVMTTCALMYIPHQRAMKNAYLPTNIDT